MPQDHLPRPKWLTFDCYGTLIQWDEGLQAAVSRILATSTDAQDAPTPAQFLHVYDEHEHRLERLRPYLSPRRRRDAHRQHLRHAALP
ncbi:hypothetical protein G6F35_018374 [Rhizopus arrhizus]|nr:hypothetical protein G6F35_018374 [Rhizopus arrhizus]